MKKIYLFSGLGADERAFKRLDFGEFEPVFIQWIMPLAGESLEHYARRLTEQIKTKNPILVGFSFGGMIATEAAKFVEPEKIILIASVKTRKELPFYYRWAGLLNLHKLVPLRILKHPGILNCWLFGVRKPEDKKLFAEILRDTDNLFLKWAIDRVVKWRNRDEALNVQHIHGTADRVLPFRFVKTGFPVNGGGHFMTVTKHTEISLILKKMLIDR